MRVFFYECRENHKKTGVALLSFHLRGETLNHRGLSAFLALLLWLPLFVDADDKVYDFHIPRMPIEAALEELAIQSHTALLFPHSEALAGRTNAVIGHFTVMDALDLMLKNTGVSGYLNDSGVLTITTKPLKSDKENAGDSNMLDNKKRGFFASLAALLTVMAPGIHADTDSASNTSEVGSPQVTKVRTLEEVIVTAMRREEGLQSVPIAVTAISGGDLEDAGVFSSIDLTQVVPNLTFSPTGHAFHPTIRGVGTRSVSMGDEANVSMYVDGVYQPDITSTAFDFFDIERVEVLRGPQGTLFGRNSTGGLINIITAKPSFDLTGKAAIRYGSFHERSVKGYLSGPFTDTFAGSLAVNVQGEDGYIDDLLRGRKFGEQESLSARTKLLFLPTESSEIILSLFYSKQEDLAQLARQPFNGNTSTVLNDPNVIVPMNPREVAQNTEVINEHENLSTDLQISLAFNAFDFKSTTSFQDYDAHSLIDADSSPLNLRVFDINDETKAFTQEIRLISNESSDWRWIVGAFGFHSTGRYEPLTINSVLSFDAKNITKSYALFAEGTLPITQNLSVTGGVRYTDEDREFDTTFNGNPVVVGAKTSFSEVTPRVVLEYQVGELGIAYFSYSRGFKSGVFNTVGTDKNPVEPEILDAYEVGLKLDPLDNLRTNFSLFHYQYDDIQLSAQDQTTAVVRLLNAASAKVTGFEAEATWRVSDNLDLSMFGTYLDAEYDDFPGAVVNQPIPNKPGNKQAIIDASGATMIRSPEYTFSVRGDYHHALANDSVVGVSGSAYYSDELLWDFEGRLVAPSYTMVNGELYWRDASDRYRVALWVQNLLDEDVVVQMLTNIISDDVQYGKPLTFGIGIQAGF